MKHPSKTALHATDKGAEPHSPQFQTVRPSRAFEEIAAQIRTELAEGRLKVGSRLPSERVLAQQFDVSRNTLREALRSLEHAGLIRLQKGATGGAFVSEGTGTAIINSLVDLYSVGSVSTSQLTEARIWLESVIVREACERATPESLKELQANIDMALKASEAGDFEQRSRLHLEFHKILTRMTGNPIMVIVMDGLLKVLEQFIMTIGADENSFVFASRKRFMKHMTDHNPEAAVKEMENSLKRLQRVYLSRAEER
jgi:GntR family transcriptional repressor for pyruvate dehydrogenase complex